MDEEYLYGFSKLSRKTSKIDILAIHITNLPKQLCVSRVHHQMYRDGAFTQPFLAFQLAQQCKRASNYMCKYCYLSLK